MVSIEIEKRFAILCQIVRAQHFAWRQAVTQLCPDVDPHAVVDRMWEVTGQQTAQAYARRLDSSRPLAAQVAECIAWSSQCMGEDATVEGGSEAATGAGETDETDEADEAYVRHSQCPWFAWHERMDLVAEDRPGCDRWFHSTLKQLSLVLGKNLRFETKAALPEGGSCCLRRIWVEK